VFTPRLNLAFRHSRVCGRATFFRLNQRCPANTTREIREFVGLVLLTRRSAKLRRQYLHWKQDRSSHTGRIRSKDYFGSPSAAIVDCPALCSDFMITRARAFSPAW
jgi:hypothetical protein